MLHMRWENVQWDRIESEQNSKNILRNWWLSSIHVSSGSSTPLLKKPVMLNTHSPANVQS